LVSSSASRAPVFVVTGPSGAGKGTLLGELLRRRPELRVAVSATTRPRRPGEHDGRDYVFLSEDEFGRRVEAGGFLEHIAYVTGHRYGTLWTEIDRIAGAGEVCILELELRGALAVEERMPGAISIFVNAPLEELERRLRERATESSGEIDDRVALARSQLKRAADFDHVVENESVEQAVAELSAIIDRELAQAAATIPLHESPTHR